MIEPGPRLGVRFRPFGDTWLKAQIGRFAQTASLPVAVPGFESFGLGTFGTQTSARARWGSSSPFGEALALDVTSYYQRMLLTDLASVFNYDPSDKSVLLELRDGESYGVEVMLRRPQTHRFYGWLSYTLSWSQRLVGPSEARAWSDWDQRHVLNLVGGFRFRGGYSLGARFHLNTGRPYPVFDDDNPGPPEYIRLPTFYQLDLRGDRRFVFDKYIARRVHRDRQHDAYPQRVRREAGNWGWSKRRRIGSCCRRWAFTPSGRPCGEHVHRARDRRAGDMVECGQTSGKTSGPMSETIFSATITP